jgi:hypothetical protein
MNKEIEQYKKYFLYPTNHWKLYYIRLNADKTVAFATMKYFYKKEEKYLSFTRNCNETKSFFSWKAIVPNSNI